MNSQPDWLENLWGGPHLFLSVLITEERGSTLPASSPPLIFDQSTMYSYEVERRGIIGFDLHRALQVASFLLEVHAQLHAYCFFSLALHTAHMFHNAVSSMEYPNTCSPLYPRISDLLL